MLKYQREITSETSVGATISNGAVAFATGFLNQSKDEIDGLIFLLSLCTLPYTITEDINTPDDDINLTGLLAKKVMDISKIRSGDEFKNSYYENAAGYVNEKAASGFKDGEEGYKKIEQAGEFISSIVFIVSFGKIFGGQASTEAPTGITQKIFNSKNVAVAGATGLSALGEESVEDINSEDMTDADYIKSYFHTIVGGVIDSGISLVGGLIEKVFPLNEENPWVSMIKRAFSKGTVDALDVPLDALIDTMFNGKSYQENFENAGGFQSMMQRFLLSASGSAVDDSLSFKDYDTAVDSKAGKIDNIDDDFNTKTDGYLDDNYGGKVDSIDDFKGKTDVKLDDGKQPKDDVSSINSDEIEKYKNDYKEQEEKKKASSITAKDVMEAIKSYGSSFSSNSQYDIYIYNYIILPVDQTYGDGCGYQMILDYLGGVVSFDDTYYAVLNSIPSNELKNFAFNLSRYNDIKNGKYNFYIDKFDEMPSYGGNQSTINDNTYYKWTDPFGHEDTYKYNELVKQFETYSEMFSYEKLEIPKLYTYDNRYYELIDYVKNKHNIKEEYTEQIIRRIDDPGCCTYDTKFKMLEAYLFEHPEMQQNFKNAFGYNLFENVNGKNVLHEDMFLIDMYMFYMKKNGTIKLDSDGSNEYIIDYAGKPCVTDFYKKQALNDIEFASSFYNQNKYDKLFNEFLSSKGLNYCQYSTTYTYSYMADSGLGFNTNDFYKNVTLISNILKQGGKVELCVRYNKSEGDIVEPRWCEDGSNNSECIISGSAHSMFVTGICEDGIYVSSYGKKYKILFNHFTEGLTFQFNCVNIS